MFSQFLNVKIKGMATTLPEHEVDNMSFADEFGEQVVKKQIKVTGITKRRTVIGEQCTLDLMLHSAERLMKDIQWSGDDVDVLLFASGYESLVFPATGFLAQKQLGIKEECVIYDMNLACTGTVDGLYTMAALLQQCGAGAKGLLLIGETTTIGGAGADKTTSMLSSDCGVAVAVELKDNSSICFSQKTDGSRYEVLVRQNEEDHIHMDGMEVFQFAITDVVASIKEFFDYYGIEDIDYYVIHQAQKFIVDKVARFAGFSKDKILNSYQWYGNTGGASDICSVCANDVRLKTKEKVKLFITGFGAGLSWGMAVFSVDTEFVLPVDYTDIHYEI